MAKAPQSLASRCGSTLVTLASGEGEIGIKAGSKHVIHISMPHLEGYAKHRKEALAKHGASRYEALKLNVKFCCRISLVQ